MTARWILFAAMVVSLLLPLTITASVVPWRACRIEAASLPWVGAFRLSAPALWPAGTPERHAETVHPAVDLRGIVGMEPAP